MIEFDVDMGYLLEDGEPDCVTLNDENGEFEPMTFYRDGADAVAFCKRVEQAVEKREPLTLFGVDYEACEECERVKRGTKPDGTPRYRCSVCGYGLGDYRWAYCPKCGAKVREAVKR